MKPIWIWRSHDTATHQIDTQRVTPVMRTIGMRWSGGGWLWQYPTVVKVMDERNGAQQRIRIPDPTRTAVWCLIALTLFFSVVTVMALWPRQRVAITKG